MPIWTSFFCGILFIILLIYAGLRLYRKGRYHLFFLSLCLLFPTLFVSLILTNSHSYDYAAREEANQGDDQLYQFYGLTHDLPDSISDETYDSLASAYVDSVNSSYAARGIEINKPASNGFLDYFSYWLMFFLRVSFIGLFLVFFHFAFAISS